MRNNSLENALVRYQVYLERYKRNRALALEKVEMELGKKAAAMLEATGVTEMRELTRRQLDRLIAEVAAAEESATEGARRVLERELKSLSSYAAKVEVAAINKFTVRGRRAKKPRTGMLWPSSLNRIMSATGEPAARLIKNWGETKKRKFGAMMRRGWAEGWTSARLARAIRGTRRNNFRDGLAAVKARQARAIANTSIQQVSSAARQTVWEQNGDVVEGYRWLSTLDSKTTPICRSYDGKVFGVGEGPLPPAHINCRSTTVPELKDEFAILDEGATRASIKGQVDADLSYYEWLKRQPKSFQEDVLGVERAKIFRDGGLTADEFSRINVNAAGRQLTLKELRERQPQLFNN